MANENRNILKNVSWTFLAKIVAMVFAFAIDILIARILGIENYAEWTFFYTTVTMMFYLSWFGINASVKVFVSKQVDDQDRAAYIYAGLTLRTVISLVFSFLILFLSEQIAVMLGYPEKYPNFLALFKSAGILVFLNSFAEFFKELDIGLQKYAHMFWITVAEFSLNFFCGFIGAYVLKSVIGIAYGYITSGIVVLIIGFSGLKMKQYYGQKSDKYWKSLKKTFQYAIPLLVISVGGMVLTEMDTFMLGIISTKQEVSMYSIAKQLCSKAAHINYALATGTLTSFSVINASNIGRKKSELKKLSNLNLLIAGIISSVFIIAGTFAISILYGDDYAYAGNIIKWLVPYYILNSISTFFSLFLDFQGKAGTRSICYCSVLVINFVLNWVLIPRYGAIGASIATGLSLIPYVIVVVMISIKFLKV